MRYRRIGFATLAAALGLFVFSGQFVHSGASAQRPQQPEKNNMELVGYHDLQGRRIDAQLGEAIEAVALAALGLDDHRDALDLQGGGIADRADALALAAELDDDVLAELSTLARASTGGPD